MFGNYVLQLSSRVIFKKFLPECHQIFAFFTKIRPDKTSGLIWVETVNNNNNNDNNGLYFQRVTHLAKKKKKKKKKANLP